MVQSRARGVVCVGAATVVRWQEPEGVGRQVREQRRPVDASLSAAVMVSSTCSRSSCLAMISLQFRQGPLSRPRLRIHHPGGGSHDCACNLCR